MLGGLARRASWLKEVQKEGAVLLVDSGDLFFERAPAPATSSKAVAKARVLAQALSQLGAAAINVGDRDLWQGVEFLKGLEKLPLISANLIEPVDKKGIFPPYVVQEVSGVRFAFFGLVGKSTSSATGGWELQEPVEAAKRVLEELKGKADVIILLSDLGWDEDVRLAKACPGIDFILGGHEGRYVKTPYQEGNTFIIQSYQKGMYAGRLRLRIERPGIPFQDVGTIDRIQEQIEQLEVRIRDLKTAKERNPYLDITRALEKIGQEKERLKRELREAKKMEGKGNSFRWSLEPIPSSLPEDPEVRRLIEEAGLSSD